MASAGREKTTVPRDQDWTVGECGYTRQQERNVSLVEQEFIFPSVYAHTLVQYRANFPLVSPLIRRFQSPVPTRKYEAASSGHHSPYQGAHLDTW